MPYQVVKSSVEDKIFHTTWVEFPPGPRTFVLQDSNHKSVETPIRLNFPYTVLKLRWQVRPSAFGGLITTSCYWAKQPAQSGTTLYHPILPNHVLRYEGNDNTTCWIGSGVSNKAYKIETTVKDLCDEFWNTKFTSNGYHLLSRTYLTQLSQLANGQSQSNEVYHYMLYLQKLSSLDPAWWTKFSLIPVGEQYQEFE